MDIDNDEVKLPYKISRLEAKAIKVGNING